MSDKEPPKRKIRRRVGFLALVPDLTKEPPVDIEWGLHYNARLYRTPEMARAQAQPDERAERKIRKAKPPRGVEPVGRFLIVDTDILEEGGLTPQQEKEFAENMILYWHGRYEDADRRAGAGVVEPAEPTITHPRRKARRRQPQTDNITNQALVMGAAAAIGTIIGNLITPPGQPAQAPAPASPFTAISSALFDGGGTCISRCTHTNYRCQLVAGHTGQHRFAHFTWEP